MAADHLAEIKCINAGVSRYPRGNRAKAVDRRARALPGEYRSKLAKLDQQYHGTAPGQVGVLQHRLETRWPDLLGLVVGQFGEGSLPLHSLVESLAQARVDYQARAWGKPPTDWALGTTLAQYRRLLSCTFVRSQAMCLLARLGCRDEGARTAADRRARSMRQEELLRKEARAYHEAYIRGRRGTGQLVA